MIGIYPQSIVKKNQSFIYGLIKHYFIIRIFANQTGGVYYGNIFKNKRSNKSSS